MQVLKAIYGMLESALLFYKKFRADLEEIGYEINPYDMCVANKIINGKQHTVTWHVDDLKFSHEDPKVNDKPTKWLEDKYGRKEHPVKFVRGPRHDYLGMTLDYSVKGEVKIDMVKYVKSMVNDFPEDLGGKSCSTPANENLFKLNPRSGKLSQAKKEFFTLWWPRDYFSQKDLVLTLLLPLLSCVQGLKILLRKIGIN